MALSKIESKWNPSGAGAGFAFMSMGSEDDLFHHDAEYTHWRQTTDNYAPFHMSMLYHPMTNVAIGSRMTCELSRSPDFLWKSYFFGFLPGLRPCTAAGVTSTSYVNAVIFYVIKSMAIKIGNHTLFEIDGKMMLLMCELAGVLDDFAELCGFNYTKKQLITDSGSNRILAAPFYGLPFQEDTDTAFNPGSITFHSITVNVHTRNLTDIFVNYDGTPGQIAIPLNVNTGSALSSSSDFDFGVAAQMVWISKQERTPLVFGFSETIFQEMLIAGEKDIPANLESNETVKLELDMKGPVTWILLQVQSKSDLSKGNWIKDCDDFGEDYVKEFMLITSSTAREDGLPAQFSRTAKLITHFGLKGYRRHGYLFSFEIDHTMKGHKGHQTMTNVDKKRFEITLFPHSALHMTAYYGAYNGWYTNRGTGGKVWGD